MHLHQRLALSAFTELFARFVREGRFTSDEVREINHVTQLARVAFDEPPPRSRPHLVRVGDHDPEPVYERQLSAVAGEMAVPS